jgi:hypothetical protein
MVIGFDFHTCYQRIAMLDEATGELTERRQRVEPTSEALKLKQEVLGGKQHLKFCTPIWEEFWCQFWRQLVCYIGTIAGTS